MKRKQILRRMAVCWGCLALAVVMCMVGSLFYVKPFVFTYAKSQAETIVLRCANEAVLQVLSENQITYDGISKISRDANGLITGVEIDIVKVNTLKSKISNSLFSRVADSSFYDLYIPVGTLVGSEYTTGFGPKVHFKMQLTETSRVDFKSNFKSTGINQVLHQILIKIDISVNVLMLGFTEGFNVSTTAIAAQTVIVGAVPDAFTNVVEHPGDDIADEIFNYADIE